MNLRTVELHLLKSPVFGDMIDLQRFAELGKKGVLALMADSTNAEREGFTKSEKTVGRTFDNLFNDNQNHRIIIATFASNVDRVQQIINSAYMCVFKDYMGALHFQLIDHLEYCFFITRDRV